jgi:hypothetical protein
LEELGWTRFAVPRLFDRAINAARCSFCEGVASGRGSSVQAFAGSSLDANRSPNHCSISV